MPGDLRWPSAAMITAHHPMNALGVIWMTEGAPSLHLTPHILDAVVTIDSGILGDKLPGSELSTPNKKDHSDEEPDWRGGHACTLLNSVSMGLTERAGYIAQLFVSAQASSVINCAIVQ